jgi:SAM-dependent methyltransferase
MSNPPSSSGSYVEHVARLERRLSTDEALRRAVGGEFLAVGKLEYYLLRSRGLKENHLVVDVGCGSGRLACQLAPFPHLRYIGCDVVPRLLEYAGELCERPDWSFVATNGATIPCDSGVADFVCFFSVFTHLSQEDIYRYFREAHRVLKPGGLLVMSFLEFRVPSHWATFIASVDQTREDQHLNQFIERDSIHAWAAPAGFDVRSIHGGDTLYIPLPEEVVYESSARASGAGSLGQSVAILQKRDTFAESGPEAHADVRVATTTTHIAAPSADHAAPPARNAATLRNVSARSYVPAAGSATVGFMLGGTAECRVLIRAIGPSLSVFGVPNPIAAPTLEIFSGETQHGRATSGWGGATDIAAAAAKVGAFTIGADSADAALVVSLPPGNYTAVVKGSTATDSGDVLVEVYLVP